jgi:hypothetical protein
MPRILTVSRTDVQGDFVCQMTSLHVYGFRKIRRVSGVAEELYLFKKGSPRWSKAVTGLVSVTGVSSCGARCVEVYLQ